MTSIVQDIARKRDGDRETLDTGAGENGRKFQTIWEEEIDELLPNNIARMAMVKHDLNLPKKGYMTETKTVTENRSR